MKLFAYIFILISFFASGLSQSKIVKKETQTSYILNKDGKLIPDGNVIEKHYNKSGKVVYESNKTFWQEANREVNYIKKYFYTNEIILDSSFVYDGDKLLLKVEHNNDSTGLEIGAVEILPSGKKSFNAKYHYNEKRQKVKEQLFSSDGILFTLKEYFYDSNGKLSEERGYDRGTPKYRFLFRYDKKGFLIEKKHFDGNNKLVKLMKYKNDKYGLPLECKETSFTGKEKSVKIIKYSYEYY